METFPPSCAERPHSPDTDRNETTVWQYEWVFDGYRSDGEGTVSLESWSEGSEDDRFVILEGADPCCPGMETVWDAELYMDSDGELYTLEQTGP